MKQRNVVMQKVVSVLLLVALLLTFATPVFAEGGPGPEKADPFPDVPKAGDQWIQNLDGVEYLNVRDHEFVLFFPDDFVPDDTMLSSKPEWINLNEDGTLPSQVVVPSYVKVPRYLFHPEMEIDMPDETGNLVTITLPATEVDLLDDIMLSAETKVDTSLMPDRRGVRKARVYNVRVVPAIRDHCRKNRALGRVHPRAKTNRLRGHSRLWTWVPSHGNVGRWGFWRPSSRVAQLCIPKSVYWTYIAPFSGTTTWWYQFSRYNNPRNWWFTYPSP